ncbi:hypothetical protein Lser_V15G15954 [Lactuca serriola]
MAKTKSMTRSHNEDKRFKTCDNGGAADLNHDVLFLVMMQLRFIDFLAFSGVCKSWRSFAHSNRNKFMASRPPMLMWIHYFSDKNEYCLEDFQERRFKTLFPRSSHRGCVGLTYGYIILFSWETKDFWLVNPITKHELYFPCVPNFDPRFMREGARAVLVFSTSISGWVFVMTYRLSDKIWFCIHGKGGWNHVSSTFPILDLHAFKGKIYALNNDWGLYEMSLNPQHPKLTLLEINNCLKSRFLRPKLVSLAGEKLYVIDHIPGKDGDLYRVQELDFGKMKWVLQEEKTTGEEYVFFLSILLNGAPVDGAAVKLGSQYKMHECFPNISTRSRKGRFYATQDMWYFPHECMNVHHLID